MARSILTISGGGLAFIVLIWSSTIYYRTEEYSVCQECGARMTTRIWFRGVHTTIKVKPSEFSEMLERHSVGKGHAHRWEAFSAQLASWSGRLYEDSFQAHSAVLLNASEGAGFMDNLYTYGDPTEADLWRRRLLDLSTAEAGKRALESLDRDGAGLPLERLETKEQFDAWWKVARPVVEEVLEKDARNEK